MHIIAIGCCSSIITTDGTASHCHGNVPGLSSRLPPADSATSSIPLSVRRS